MYLGRYRFDGDPTPLLSAYERMLARFDPATFTLHVCTVDEHGITVFDACPDEATFRSFSTSPDWLMACASAGLPPAVVTAVGDVHRVHAREVVSS